MLLEQSALLDFGAQGLPGRVSLTRGGQVSINLGILLGYIVGYALKDFESNWRLMLGAGAVLPLGCAQCR